MPGVVQCSFADQYHLTCICEVGEGESNPLLEFVDADEESDRSGYELGGRKRSPEQPLRESSGAETGVNQHGRASSSLLNVHFWRLPVLWVACTICAGVVPGMSVFVNLLAQAGVFGDLCPRGEGAPSGSEQPHTCDEQFAALTEIFNAASGISIFALLPIGLIFDSYGARTCAVSGAGLLLIGLLVMQVPLLGAAHGCGPQTILFLPVAVFISDIGSLLNSQCMLGLVWHFPSWQVFVISLSNATYQAAAMLPMLFELVMRETGCTLSSALFVYVVVVLAGLCLCYFFTPSQTEFFAEAKRVLGIPLPPPPKRMDCWGTFRNGNRVLSSHMGDHAWTLLLGGIGFAHCTLYQSLAGDYGPKLFGHPGDGARLAGLFSALNAIIGGALAPFAITMVDKFGLHVLVGVFVLCHFCVSIFVEVPSWAAQAAVCVGIVIFIALFLTFILKYTLVYAPPNRIGVVQGLLFAYAMVLNLPIVLVVQGWMQSLPDNRFRIGTPLCVSAGVATLSMAIYACRFYLRGLPELPTLLPEDEVELAKPFGCKTLDEVCYVLHMNDRLDLIKKLSSTDPGVLIGLLQAIDADRMAEKVDELDAEELADMIEAGTVEPPVASEEQLVAASEEHLKQAAADHMHVELTEVTWAEDTAELSDHSNVSTGLATWGSDHGTSGGQLEPSAGAVGHSRENSGASPPGHPDGAAMSDVSQRVLKYLNDGDRDSLTELFLQSPVDDLWQAFVDLEGRFTPAEFKELEGKLDGLISNRQFAQLLRQRRELKVLVARMSKKRLRQMLKRSAR